MGIGSPHTGISSKIVNPTTEDIGVVDLCKSYIHLMNQPKLVSLDLHPELLQGIESAVHHRLWSKSMIGLPAYYPVTDS